MADMYDILEEHKGKIIMLAVLIAAFVVALYGYSYYVTSTSIATEFSKISLKAGESTVLTVILTNPYPNDYSNVMLSVKPVDPTSMAVLGTPQTEEVFGAGEIRKFYFNINIAQYARPGTYSLDVLATFGLQNQTKRVLLTVVE